MASMASIGRRKRTSAYLLPSRLGYATTMPNAASWQPALPFAL
jgi:hypothetical protein